MEVIDIVSHYIDKTQNLINIEFRMMGDDDDVVREDFIEYSYFEEFGFDKGKNFDIFESIMDEEDEWGDDDFEYVDDDATLLSFLNEYYVVYPKKIPKPEFK